MSQDATVRAKSDTWVEHDSPNANHGNGAKLRLRSDATNHGRQALVHFKRPFEPGETILLATLLLYRRDAWATGHPIKVRRVTESWKENRASWANKPASDAASEITFSAPAGADKDELAIDVTALVTDWAAGDPCHGFRLELGDDETHAVYAAEAPQDGTAPKLYVQWTQAPYPPSNLNPSGGDAVSVASPRVAWRFSDKAGESQTQGWSQVQISATNDFSGALLYDSLQRPNTRWSWALAGEYALAPGDTVWWRVRTWDGAGFVSGWSNAAKFTYTPKGTITILSPPVAPGNVVDDLTPTVLFSWAGGGTLERVDLKLWRVEASGKLTELFKFPEQAVESTFGAITLQRKRDGKTVSMIRTGETYRIGLKGFDDVNRAHTQGDPAFAYAQRDFTYQRSGAPAPVDSLTATATAAGPATTHGKPKVHLTWHRATAPDFFTLVANGIEVIPRIDPADVATATAGTYEMDYWRALDGEITTFEVEAVEIDVGTGSRQNSDGNATDAAIVDVRGKWLVDEDDSLAVQIADAAQPDFEIGESGDTKNPVGARRPVRTTDAVRGNEGGIAGVVRSTAEKDDFLTLKGRMKELRYLQGRFNVPVRLGQSAAPPRSSTSGKDWWNVSTDVFQVDEFFPVAGR